MPSAVILLINQLIHSMLTYDTSVREVSYSRHFRRKCRFFDRFLGLSN